MFVQHGWAIVMVVGEIAATGQRGSVQPPSPPVYTNSMSLGLRQLSIVASAVVYPLAVVAVIFVGSAPPARSARTPLT